MIMITYKNINYISGDSIECSIDGEFIIGKIFIEGNKCWVCHDNSSHNGNKAPDRLGYKHSWEFHVTGTGLSDEVELISNISGLSIPKRDCSVASNLVACFQSFNLMSFSNLLFFDLCFPNISKLDISKNKGMIYLESSNKRKLEVKIGRFLTKSITDYNKLVPNERKITTTNDVIEKFTNHYIAYQATNMVSVKYLVGQDIPDVGYNSKHQLKISVLGNSCMNDKFNYLDLYVNNTNKIKLMVVMIDNKVVGRSLIWKLDNGKTYMDRIYSAYDWIGTFMYNEGKLNGYTTILTDQDTITPDNTQFEKYPYMDTFKFMDDTGMMYSMRTNYKQSCKYLQSTGGGFSTLPMSKD